MHMHLQPADDGDERAGYPSASEYGRLLKCRASFLMAKKARALGQVAHERSEAADLGTKKHLANVEGPDILSAEERADWEICQRKREEFLAGWFDADHPVETIKECRLWLRKGLRPLLTGKPDEILRQGARVSVLDHKYGNYRVDDPRENVQLTLYALLAAREDDRIEEVTCQIFSPFFDFEPVTFAREELDELYRSVVVVVDSLEDPGAPVAGDHCHFCPARLICSEAKTQAVNATLANVTELPSGEQAAKLLDAIKQAQALFKEIEGHYKRLLEETPGAVPGWMLAPGDVRRSIESPYELRERLADLFSIEEFLSFCSPSVRLVERAWARKTGIPVTRAREPFKRMLGALLTEKRCESSLQRVEQAASGRDARTSF